MKETWREGGREGKSARDRAGGRMKEGSGGMRGRRTGSNTCRHPSASSLQDVRIILSALFVHHLGFLLFLPQPLLFLYPSILQGQIPEMSLV